MVIFTGDLFYTKDNLAIAMKFVESFQISGNEELTIDRLKDNRTFRIVTVSGKEYVLDVETQLTQYQRSAKNVTPDEWLEAIFTRWRHIVTGKTS